MKTLKLFTIYYLPFIIYHFSNAQNLGVNSTGANPHPSAILDVDAAPSNDKGFLKPRLTTAQRIAMVSPADGLEVYDTNLGGTYRFSTINNKWDCAQNPAGTVQYFANLTAPIGYLECNGQSVSTTQYPELFNAIGYLYGGVGANFNVPDLRGEFVRGLDNGRGADPGRVVGTNQSPSPVIHDDTFGAASQNGDFSMDQTASSYCDAWPGNIAGGIPDAFWAASPSGGWTVYSGTSTGGSAYGMISASRPRNVALLTCIKY